MKKQSIIIRELINITIMLLPFLYIILAKEKLPPFAPFSHSSDQTMYQAVLFVTGVSVPWYLFFLIKPVMIPKSKFSGHTRSFQHIRTIMLVFTSLLCFTFIARKTGIPFNWARIGIILSFTFVMVVGNLYPTLKNKQLIGIKNTWTRSDDLIWKKTHQFAGKVFFFGGFLGVLYSLLFDIAAVSFMPVMLVGYMFLLISIPNIYSYILYRKSVPSN